MIDVIGLPQLRVPVDNRLKALTKTCPGLRIEVRHFNPGSAVTRATIGRAAMGHDGFNVCAQ